MEELQDAIEDAQYVNAISTQEDGPRPVLPWEIPTEEQLAEWQEKVRNKALANPEPNKAEPFTIEWVISGPIGFFLFSAFLKEVCEDHLRINFVEEVVRFKKLRGSSRFPKAKSILGTYLIPPKMDEATGEPRLPKKTEIDEFDLEREKPDLHLSPEQLDSLISLNLLQTTMKTVTTTTAATDMEGEAEPRIQKTNIVIPPGANVVGVQGPVLDEVFQKMQAIESALLTQGNKSDSMPVIPGKANALSSSVIDQLSPTNTTNLSQGDATTQPPDTQPSGNGTATNDATEQQHHDDEAGGEAAGGATGGTTGGGEEKPNSNKSEELDLHTSMRNLTKRLDNRHNYGRVPVDLFDKVETVVLESLRRDYWDMFLQSEQHTKYNNFLWYRDRPVVQEDFFVMRVLGRGGFGLVTACKKGTSGKLYAMKVMNKRRIKMKKSELLAVNERMALAAVESNFVVNLKYSFHSNEEVFLILDLMTGGDLGYHLHQKGRFPKKECLYYAARIMLGLQALHNQQYVYRDLKPENCLLADDGRVKITDLGLATKITPTLHGAAGTRGYWAPEMLRRDKKGRRMPYGHTVDWFSFGCCIAEFISGSNPFRSEAALNFGLGRGKQTKEKAIDCATLEMDPVFDPEKFEPDAADLCRRLLDKNENTRLGTNGCEEIMAHPWFKSINWESIISDRKRPPFLPPKDVNAASQSEIGTFAEDKALQEMVIDSKDEEVYKDWDWTNHRAFAAEVIEFLIYERETGEPLVPVAQHASCCCSIL